MFTEGRRAVSERFPLSRAPSTKGASFLSSLTSSERVIHIATISDAEANSGKKNETMSFYRQ